MDFIKHNMKEEGSQNGENISNYLKLRVHFIQKRKENNCSIKVYAFLCMKILNKQFNNHQYKENYFNFEACTLGNNYFISFSCVFV